MKVTITFDIDLKVLKRASDGYDITVLGVSDLHVCPSGKGMGTSTLDALKKLADRMNCECAAAFINFGEIEFYRKCGWSVSEDTHGSSNHYLVLSEPIGIVRPIKETW